MRGKDIIIKELRCVYCGKKHVVMPEKPKLPVIIDVKCIKCKKFITIKS